MSHRCSGLPASEIFAPFRPRTGVSGSETAHTSWPDTAPPRWSLKPERSPWSEIVHHVIDGIQIEHRVPNRGCNIGAAIEERPRVHRLDVYRDLRGRGARAGPTRAIGSRHAKLVGVRIGRS